MYRMRKWAVRHAKSYNTIYQILERMLIKIHPVLLKIGYQRIEKPITFIERNIKGLLFDCQMCGQCVLSDTGMSCPMNCPKELRNGPCGGVRPNGHCEVNPEMRCVWVEAYHGSKQMGSKHLILPVQLPIDHRLQGTSSWLRAAKIKREQLFFRTDSDELC